MAFALIFVGLLLAVSAVRGTHQQLFALVKTDLTGAGNFGYWLVVIIVIGSIGYLPPFRTLSKALLVVIVLALLLSKGNPNLPGGGFFTQLFTQFTSGTKTAPSNPITV
jgi:hypothetical protein